jgi:hypothetical protein
MWRIVAFVLLAGCSVADQESVRTVAAIEIPLREQADRAALIGLLQRHAKRAGLHVDDVSEKWREFERQANQISPQDRVTFNVGVWRGTDDDENEMVADDRFHPGRVWVTFPRGSEADRSRRFSEPLIAEIRQRWPEAKMLPILPWGGLPHARDLVLVGGDYRIARSAAVDYELAPSLQIFAPR